MWTIKKVLLLLILHLFQDTVKAAQCPALGTLQPMAGFDENRILGEWKQVRWYWPSTSSSADVFDDVIFFFYKLKNAGPDDSIFKIGSFKRTVESSCSARIFEYTKVGTPGVYRDFGGIVQNTRRVFIWTDYDNIAVEFGCVDPQGDQCGDVTAFFLFRHQGQPTVQQIKVMEKALKDICYPTKKDFGDAPHTGGCSPDMTVG